MSTAIAWSALTEQMKNYILKNPCQFGVYVFNSVVFIVPALVTGPVLSGLGFTALGPTAGTFAASAQSMLAPVGAGSIFATAQSAAMGGYGAAVIAGTAQAGSILSSAAVLARSVWRW